ncbi:MAG: hypothetical protein KJZ57_09340, partial [Anaerolineales bacterium]|nr:hypothetical protein [Anaerolineales bacterium]
MVKPIVFLCLIVLLSGCLPLPTRQVTLGPTEILPDTEEMLAAPVLGSTEVIRLNSNQCASSAVTLAFPVGTEKEPPYDSRPRVILPPPEWEEEIVLPNALPYTSLHQRSARSIVIQAPNGNEYLWFSTGDTEDSGVYRYDPKSRQLLLYNTIDGYDAYPVDLFISSDGTLWGYTIVGYQQEVRENLSLLSRYEPETDSFVFVNDPLLTDNGKLFTRITDMTIDRQGIIWIAVRRDKAS